MDVKRWKSWSVIFMTMMVCSVTNVDAYTVVLKDGSTMEMETVQKSTQLRYGGVQIPVNIGDVERVKVERHQDKNVLPQLGLVGVAEASAVYSQELITLYSKTHRTIKSAPGLDQLREVLSEAYFQRLQNKVDQGADARLVLELTRGLIPEKVEVYDMSVSDNSAQLLALADGFMGEQHGIITMVQEEDRWLVDNEVWLGYDADKIRKAAPIKGRPLRFDFSPGRTDLMDTVNDDYALNRNVLDLTPSEEVSFQDNAFALFFFVERGKGQKAATDEPRDLPGVSAVHNNGGRVHVIWPGSRSIWSRQKRFNENKPLDFSLAHEDDGYKSGNVNLRLPRKTPKEVSAGFLYKF